jgi:N-acetylneuraminic acid mutarotase
MQPLTTPRNHLPLAASVGILLTVVFAGCLGNLGERSGEWEVRFEPELDLGKCNTTQANLTTQVIQPNLNGEVAVLWPTDSSTPAISVRLQLNDTAFFGNLKCVSTSANGVLSGGINGDGYSGKYRFSGQQGNVTITRSYECQGQGCGFNGDCGPQGCNQGCQGPGCDPYCSGPGCNGDCGSNGCDQCQYNCNNGCQGSDCNNNCGPSGCNGCQVDCNNGCQGTNCDPGCAPNCATDVQGLWHVSFQPMIDVTPCYGSSKKWSDMDMMVNANGYFDNVWSPQEPGTLRAYGWLTRGDFKGELVCYQPKPQGTPGGSMNGPRQNAASYSGTFNFNNNGGPAGMVYITREGAAPTTWSAPTTSAAPTTTSAAPTTSAPATTTAAPTTTTPPAAAWSTKAAMPQAKSGAAGAVLNGRLYVVGGNTDGTMFSYDPTSNNWSPEPTFPGAYRAYAGAAAVGGKLYVVGGCESQPSSGPDCRIGTTNKLMEFDPGTGAWTAKTPMPTARLHMAAAAIDGKLYVAGGIGACPPCTPTTAVEVYDPSTDSWTAKTPMPGGRVQPYVGVIGGRLYLAGGTNGANVLSSMQVYDPATDSWTDGTSLPAPYQTGIGAAIGNRLYVVAGQDASGANIRTVLHYDVATDAWTTDPMIPTGRYGPSAGVINGILHVAGGGPNNSNIDTLEAFAP